MIYLYSCERFKEKRNRCWILILVISGWFVDLFSDFAIDVNRHDFRRNIGVAARMYVTYDIEKLRKGAWQCLYWTGRRPQNCQALSLPTLWMIF